MRRPRWLLALLLALAVAAGFAWLGRWQMDSAIRTDDQLVQHTETPRQLAEVTAPLTGVTETAGGAVVLLTGSFVAGDSRIVSPRDNDGETGAWVVGHLRVDDASSNEAAAEAGLAVAIGWAPSEEAAARALQQLEADPAFTAERALEGRYMPPEGPKQPDADQDPQHISTMVPAQQANLWDAAGGPVYAGYLVLHPSQSGVDPLLSEAGLDAIDSVPPLPPEKVNWLNIFYAIEWVVFGGFAVFFWFRLTRDAWEKEHELKLLTAAERGDPDQES